MSKKNNLRPFKGNSLLDIPNDYVIVDIETTGFDPTFNEIIEVGAIKYIDNVKTAEFNSLVKPQEEVGDFITKLTGITNEMLSSAPLPKNVILDFKNFIGDSVLIGYNFNFDINFLYDYSKEYTPELITNDFVDLLRISRKLLPELPNHKLATVADFFNIDTKNNHRALKDCEITSNCLFKLKKYMQDNNSILTKKTYSHNYLNANDIKPTTEIFDENNFFYNKYCCFTGTLDKMKRKDAMQLVVNAGGFCENDVTRKTNFLILGNFDYCTSIKGDKSSKQIKAENLKLNGQDIEILSENLFYELINTLL